MRDRRTGADQWDFLPEEKGRSLGHVTEGQGQITGTSDRRTTADQRDFLPEDKRRPLGLSPKDEGRSLGQVQNSIWHPRVGGRGI